MRIMSRRESRRAAAVDTPQEKRNPCRPNVYVIFTNEPKWLLTWRPIKTRHYSDIIILLNLNKLKLSIILSRRGTLQAFRPGCFRCSNR